MMGNKSGGAAATKGPDNNKRLAEYEREDSRVIAFLADNGVTDLGDHSPVGALITRCKSLQECKAELEAKIAAGPETPEGGDQALIAAADRAANAESELKGTAEALAAAIVAGEHALDEGENPITAAVRLLSATVDPDVALAEANARAAAAGARVAELEAENAQLKIDVDDLVNVGEADPAVPHDAVECGPAFGNLSVADLNLRLEEGAKFDLVFSDGDREVLEFPPVRLTFTDLSRHGDRYMVNPTVLIHGPRTEGAIPIELAGAALLADGEQVGFCPFEPPLVINPGDQRQFSRSFLFG